MNPVRVVDIFAGPGGLGEGFSSVLGDCGRPVYELVLSIEMERWANKTLLLRNFFREFPEGGVPPEYYEHLRGKITLNDLLSNVRCKKEADKANLKSWEAELGSEGFPVPLVRDRIDAAIDGQANWVLIGGPPCQAYSLVGRSRNHGREDYDPAKDVKQKLYVQYLQILADHGPAVFVMENVKGLLSATLNEQHLFQMILDDLRDPSLALKREKRATRSGHREHRYRIYSPVHAAQLSDDELPKTIVQCEKFGVPQARHRVILIGVRGFRGLPGTHDRTGASGDTRPNKLCGFRVVGFRGHGRISLTPARKYGLPEGFPGRTTYLLKSFNRRRIPGAELLFAR